MKRTIIFSILAVFAIQLFADPAQQAVPLKKTKIGHHNIPMPADMPNVYYNNDTRTVIIDGGGEVSYYDVEIVSLTTLYTEISTQVSGYYDTIDVSSLSEDDYVIIIDSPTGYSFEGDFTIY